jgi:hypothetical protein
MSFITRAFARTPLARNAMRPLSTSAIVRTSAGYGDPQDEKIENKTPLGKSSTDPENKQGRTETIPTNGGNGSTSGGHGGSSGSSKGAVGSQGGKEGAGNQAKEDVSGQEIRETKKIGEEPKNTAEGGAGPKGG